MKSIIVLIILLLAISAFSQEAVTEDNPAEIIDTLIIEVAPVTSLIASDFKYDDAEKINLSWVPSIDDQIGYGNKVDNYKIFRITNGGEPVKIAEIMEALRLYRLRQNQRSDKWDILINREDLQDVPPIAIIANFRNSSVKVCVLPEPAEALYILSLFINLNFCSIFES